MTHETEIPAEDVHRSPRDALARLAMILLVLTTLAAASVALLEARAARADDRADAKAQMHAIRAEGAQARAQRQAQVLAESAARVEAQWARAGALAARRLHAPGVDGAAVAAAEVRWRALAARAERESRELADTWDVPAPTDLKPESDVYQSILADASRDRFLLDARRDAADSESAAWEGHMAKYAAIIAVLAVAAYLFGFALGGGTAGRRTLVAIGAAGVIAGSTWAAVLATQSPSPPADQAAQLFADGSMALQRGTPGDLAVAAEHFEDAREVRPDFTEAYALESQARTAAASPQDPETIQSQTAPGALDASIEALTGARDHGRTTAATLGALGFELVAEGLYLRREDEIDEGVAVTRDALAASTEGWALGDPILRFNLGMGLLALGRDVEALVEYGRAVRLTRQSDPATWQRIVSGALTDIEMVLHHGRGDEETATTAKELIVGALAAGEEGQGATGTFPAPEASVFPSDVELSFLGQVPHGTLSQQWYYRDPVLGWGAIPAISGPFDPTDRGVVPTEYLAALERPRCLEAGEYRVEIYAGDELVHQLEREAQHPRRLEGWDARSLGLRACVPAAWRPAPRAVPDLVEGMVARDQKAGLYLWTVHHAFAELPAYSRVDGALRRVLRRPGTSLRDVAVGAGTRARHRYFLGLGSPDEPGSTSVRDFWYEGGRARAGAAFHADGHLVVALVFAPDEATLRSVWDSVEVADLGLAR